jgi:hypothetical protein
MSIDEGLKCSTHALWHLLTLHLPLNMDVLSLDGLTLLSGKTVSPPAHHTTPHHNTHVMFWLDAPDV